MSYSGLFTHEAQEASYLGSAVCVPEHEESIWFCPECLVHGVENRLRYTAATKNLACPLCPVGYANDAELAQAYAEQVKERIGELEGERDSANSRWGDVEAKLKEILRVAA